MGGNVTRLYPLPAGQYTLTGLYLSQELRRLGTPERPFVYTNFITSLDGRISQPDPASGRRRVPPAIANPRDWRLHIELAAQADVLLTTARHLRAAAAGRHADLLNIGGGEHTDLAAWRKNRGLPPQPAVAAVSAGLDIPVRKVLERCGGPLLVLTTDAAPTERVGALERQGIEVIRTGPGPQLNAAAAVAALKRRGYRHIYSIAGPQVLHALLDADVLDRLYLTIAQMTLGGDKFDTLTRGRALDPPPGFTLYELYLDPHAPAGAGQLLASFDRA